MVDELSERFAVDGVSFDEPGASGLTEPSIKAVLRHGDDSCEVYLFGAHVVSWQTAGVERFWMSSLSAMDGSGPIRGGVPIAFPQFASQGPLRLHGFARDGLWDVVDVSVSEAEHSITFGRCEDAETLALWPHAFQLRYTVSLGVNRLRLTLEVANTGEESWAFTGCLHTYFGTPDIRRLRLQGLRGCCFVDKADGMQEKVEDEDAIDIESAAAASGGLVDRIYVDSPQQLSLLDWGKGEQCILRHTDSFPDTVVFNPWEESKRGDKGPDFDDDGFNYTVCVEAAVALKPQELEPGASWAGSQCIEVAPLDGIPDGAATQEVDETEMAGVDVED